MSAARPQVLCMIGTRPEVIKMAPVIKALREAGDIDVSVVCSGQHRDLLVPLLDWFELELDADLRVMTADQTLSRLTANLIDAFESSLGTQRPRLVVAQGDTTTVMCAALSCFYQNIPFAHVEAGLRTFDVHNPFPEEFNRVAVTRLARLHFCPTERAFKNVLDSGVKAANASLTGNTVIDALHYTIAKLDAYPARRFDHDILVTAHRRENFGRPLEDICEALLDLCREFPALKILYPLHPNPNVRETVTQALSGHARIELLEPLTYPELIAAMQQAKVILTDSGGIQEEAPVLAKPVLVLRRRTERPEAIEAGVARLVGTERAEIVAATRRLLTDADHYAQMARAISPYGDGQAAPRISTAIKAYLSASGAC